MSDRWARGLCRRRRGPLCSRCVASAVLLSLLAALGLAAVVVRGTPWVYEPTSATLSFVEPGLVLGAVNSTQSSASIGPAGASANVTVVASNTSQLVSNPDFYSSPDYWYCSPGQSLSCYWIPSDTGASGGVAVIYGTLSAGESDSAFIYQPVTMPNASIASITMAVRARIASQPILVNWIVYVMGLYDPDTQQYVAYQTFTPTITYQTFTLSINPSSVTPGKQYLVVVGVAVDMSSIVLINTEDFRIDSVTLTVSTETATFSGNVLGLNATEGVFYARLVLVGLNASGSLNASITIANLTGYSSTPITISGGEALSGATSFVELNSASNVPGYYTGWVRVEASKGQAGNSTLYLYLEACTAPGGAGACSYYPLEIVIDPQEGVATLSAGASPPGLPGPSRLVGLNLSLPRIPAPTGSPGGG